MDKKYLDKVLDHMVRGTKIDYEMKEIIFPFPFSPLTFSFFPSTPLSTFHSHFLPLHSSFVKYCNRQFGLTEEEIDYVYHRYVKIIGDKI